MPSQQDEYFCRSVVLMIEHNEEGAMGITINRPTKVHSSEIFRQLELPEDGPEAEKMVFTGGPVQLERGFVIHRPVNGQEMQSSLQVNGGLNVTSSHDMLELLAKCSAKTDSRIVLGYAGWDAGQLEKEMASNAWLHIPVNNDLIFNTPPYKCWEKSLKKLGIQAAFFQGNAGHA